MGGAAVSTVALVFGLAAAVAIAARFYLMGFAFFAAHAAVTTSAVFFVPSKISVAHDTTLVRVFEATGVAVVPFAFAIADPGRALAASFLLLALVVCAAASIARGRPTAQGETSTALFRSGRGTMFWQSALCLGLAVACLQHEWFSLIAYLLGALGFFVAGIGVAASITDFES